MKTKLKFLLPALLSTAVAAPFASAQTAYTDPVGAVVVPVPAGTSIVSVPFQHPKLFQGAVSSNASGVLTVDASLVSPTRPAYVQVVVGANVGSIFPVASVSGTSITLEGDGTGISAGDVVCLREYFVVGDLGTPPIGTSVALLNAGDDAQVSVYVGVWSPSPNTPILPGEAVVINSPGFDLTLTGSVSVDDVVLPLDSGTSAVGSLDPVSGVDDLLTALDSQVGPGTTVTFISSVGTFSTSVYLGSPVGWTPQTPSSVAKAFDMTGFVINSASTDLVLPGFSF